MTSKVRSYLYKIYFVFISFLWGVFVQGVFGKGGFCPGGFCPGVYVWGVFVRGVFVLIPAVTHNFIPFQPLVKLFLQLSNGLKDFLLKELLISLTINSSAWPWLALANSGSEFVGCLGCRMSWQPEPANADSAFLASIF